MISYKYYIIPHINKCLSGATDQSAEIMKSKYALYFPRSVSVPHLSNLTQQTVHLHVKIHTTEQVLNQLQTSSAVSVTKYNIHIKRYPQQ